MKYKRLIAFLSAVLVIIAFTPIRYQSLYADLWVSFVVHFAVTLFLFHKLRLRPVTTLGFYLLAVVSLLLIDYIFDGTPFFEWFFELLWPNILPQFLAPILSYWYFRSNGKVKIAVLSLAILVYAVNIFWFWEKYLNLKNYGVYTTDVSEPLPTNWTASSIYGKSFSADSMKDKTVLIDFWSTSCPACIAAFPKLDSFYKVKRSDPKIMVQSIFVPSKRDSIGQAEAIVRKRNLSFPVVSGEIGLDSVFKIMAYPTVLVIHENRIVFRGELTEAFKRLDNL